MLYAHAHERNLDRDASLPVSCWTSLILHRLLISMMAWHLSRLASIPLLVSNKPKKTSSLDAKGAIGGVQTHVKLSYLLEYFF